jgi:hypothetical protein
MKKAAEEVAKRRLERKAEKERKRKLRVEERQARADVRGTSPIRSDSSTESVGLVSPDSEDLGHLLGDEAVEEEGEEVVQRSPKRTRTDAGPSATVGSSWSGRQDWPYWLGSTSGSGSGEGQTQTEPINTQTPAGTGGQTQTMPAVSQAPASVGMQVVAPRPLGGITKRFTRWCTVARLVPLLRLV